MLDFEKTYNVERGALCHDVRFFDTDFHGGDVSSFRIEVTTLNEDGKEISKVTDPGLGSFDDLLFDLESRFLGEAEEAYRQDAIDGRGL